MPATVEIIKKNEDYIEPAEVQYMEMKLFGPLSGGGGHDWQRWSRWSLLSRIDTEVV